MKTILKAYHKNSDVVAYHKYEHNGMLCEYIYNENGKPLNFKNSNGYSYEFIYNENGNKIAYKNSNGYSYEFIYNENGNKIAYKNSDSYYTVKGKIVSKEEYEAFINQLNSKNLDGKEAVIEGRKYKLTLIK